jgi:ribosomal protein S18 acetylase RimI-like enzyme
MTRIRKAVLADINDILRLNKALFDHETAFNQAYNLDWTYSNVGREYFEKMINSQVAVVAEVDGKVVGYLIASVRAQSFRRQNPIAELDNMFIDEHFRRHGIGKRLVIEMKEQLKKKGAKSVRVEAAFQNENAIEFYKSCGFDEFDLVLEATLA